MDCHFFRVTIVIRLRTSTAQSACFTRQAKEPSRQRAALTEKLFDDFDPMVLAGKEAIPAYFCMNPFCSKNSFICSREGWARRPAIISDQGVSFCPPVRSRM